MSTKPSHHQAKIFEATTKNPQSMMQDLIAYQPDVLAFSVYIFNVEETKRFISAIKELLPDVKIYLGGPEATYHDQALWNLPIQGIFKGEAEMDFWRALDGVEVSQLQTHRTHKVEIGRTHLLDLEAYPSPYFLAEDCHDMDKRYLYVETSRGCPFGCAYCLAALDAKVRYFSMPYLEDFFHDLAKTKVQQVKFLDRSFNLEPKRAKQLMNHCENMPESMSFHMELIGDRLSEALIEAFKNAPTHRYRMEIGVQSFNPTTLEAVSRVSNLERLSEVIQDFSKHKLQQHVDLIAGLPYEDIESFEKSYNRLIKYQANELQLGILKLLHGSSLYQHKEKYGYQVDDTAPYQIKSSLWLSEQDILDIEEVALATERLYNRQRIKKGLDEYFQTSSVSPFKLMGHLGKAMRLLQRPYSEHELFETIIDAISKAYDDSNLLHMIEKAYYLNAKQKPVRLRLHQDLQRIKHYKQQLARQRPSSSSSVVLLRDGYAEVIVYQTTQKTVYAIHEDGTIYQEHVIHENHTSYPQSA